MAPPIRGRRWATFSAPRSRTAAGTSKPSLTCLHSLGPRFRPGPFLSASPLPCGRGCVGALRPPSLVDRTPMLCIGYGCEASKAGEGSLSTDPNPSFGADCVRDTFSHKGRREEEPCFLHIAPQLM